MTSDKMISPRVELLADNPDLIPAVGQIRWMEWGRLAERDQLTWWIDVTASEAGRDELPVTFVAVDAVDAVDTAVGAVGLGRSDPDERRDRSPWVLGMVVRPELRGRGVGRLLLKALRNWACENGYQRLWVATGDSAVGFYRSCGWDVWETFSRPHEKVIVLTTVPPPGT